MGKHRSELISKLGMPVQTTPDGKGGQILTYEYDRTNTREESDGRKKLGMMFGGTETKEVGYVEIRRFWVNAGGVLYDWKVERR